MTLQQALENFSVENLDTEEILFDCDYRNDSGDQELHDKLMHNIKELCYDEDAFNELCNIEMTPEFLDKLKNNDTDDIWDDHINQTLLDAAWLVYEEIDYAERKADDDFDDLYDDEHNYQFTFGDFNLSYEYECDIDMT